MDAAGIHLDFRLTRQVRLAARPIGLNKFRQKEVPLTPEDLIRLIDAVARHQDRKAFALLFSHFAPRVKNFLMRSGLDDSIAEEVAQEVMLALWRKASYFDAGRAGASTWVFTIARNQRVDRLRGTRPLVSERAADPSQQPDAPLSGEDIAIETEREEEIKRAIGTLSSEQATIVRLSYFADKPHAEIARELAIPLGTVKSRIRLALNRLRAVLDSDL